MLSAAFTVCVALASAAQSSAADRQIDTRSLHMRDLVLGVYSGDAADPKTRMAVDALHNAVGRRFELAHLLLSAKKSPQPSAFAAADDALSHKLSGERAPALIAAHGDAALRYALAKREERFPNAAIVFSAVRSNALADGARKLPRTFGATERLSVSETILMSEKVLRRAVSRVFVVANDAALGQTAADIFREENPERIDVAFNVAETSGLTMTRLIDAITATGAQDQIVLLVRPNRLEDDTPFSVAEMMAELAKREEPPVFALFEQSVRDGALGGVVFSDQAYARRLGHLAQSYFAGDLNAAASAKANVNRMMLNTDTLARHGLAPPPGAQFELVGDAGEPIASTGWIELAVGGVAGGGLALFIGFISYRRKAAGPTLPAARAAGPSDLTDRVTGLLSWDGLVAEQDAPTGSAFCIDLEGFTKANLIFGRRGGDAVLQAAGERLVGSASPGERVARIGDDEFAILSPVSGEDAVRARAEELRDLLSAPFQLDDGAFWAGAQIGAARLDGTEQSAEHLVNNAANAISEGRSTDRRRTQELLLNNASNALAEARREGRGAVLVSPANNREKEIARQKTTGEILVGIEQEQFIPYFQPQVCATTGALVAVEALVRWRHPERGVLSPYFFMDEAVRLGVCEEIDAQMMRNSMAAVRDWVRQGLFVPQLSLNVSARRLANASVCEAVKAADFEEATLCFEVLESTFLDGMDEDLERNIATLRDAGVVFEVDDFGSGFASVLSVMRLKPQRLKIARELVMSLSEDPTTHEMARATIDIGKSLDVGVTAEGIEDETQARVLRDLGCDVFQGFYFAKPMDLSDTADFIRNHAEKNTAAA